MVEKGDWSLIFKSQFFLDYQNKKKILKQTKQISINDRDDSNKKTQPVKTFQELSCWKSWLATAVIMFKGHESC